MIKKEITIGSKTFIPVETGLIDVSHLKSEIKDNKHFSVKVENITSGDVVLVCCKRDHHIIKKHTSCTVNVKKARKKILLDVEKDGIVVLELY